MIDFVKPDNWLTFGNILVANVGFF